MSEDCCLVKILTVKPEDHFLLKIAKLTTILFSGIANLLSKIYDWCVSDSSKLQEAKDITEEVTKPEEKGVDNDSTTALSSTPPEVTPSIALARDTLDVTTPPQDASVTTAKKVEDAVAP
jgi:hypothetical protein